MVIVLLAGPVQARPPNAVSDHRVPIALAAERFGLSPDLIAKVIAVESAGDAKAVSSKGAMGLMQLMPATWRMLRARLDLGPDPFDPRDNILAGAAFLREMHDRYGSPGFLAAYNAGPGRFEDYRATGRPLPAETVAYVAMLVPVIGGDDLSSPVAVVAADPLAWTRAPLFIVQPASSQPAQPTPVDVGATAPPASHPERDPVASDVPSSTIFVARSSSAGPR